jgi:integrase
VAHVQKRLTPAGEARYDIRWRVGGAERKRSFRRARDADAFRRKIEAEEDAGPLLDPQRGNITIVEYAPAWLAMRRKPDGQPLAPRTVEYYRDVMNRYILPKLGTRTLSSLRIDDVRRWHAAVNDQAGAITAAKAYRLLRVILNTAVEDERIASNPCKIRGAGVERSPERPFVDAEIVLRLAAAIEERYSALVLLSGFGGLRLGELLGLQRADIDLERHQVRVIRQTVELKKGQRVTTAPKTDAGRRIVHLPTMVTAALVEHLQRYVDADATAPVFTGPLSEGLRRATLYKAWRLARAEVGVPDLHLHDLRHAAGTLAAQQGASVRELMARLGHASPRSVPALPARRRAERCGDCRRTRRSSIGRNSPGWRTGPPAAAPSVRHGGSGSTPTPYRYRARNTP